MDIRRIAVPISGHPPRPSAVQNPENAETAMYVPDLSLEATSARTHWLQRNRRGMLPSTFNLLQDAAKQNHAFLPSKKHANRNALVPHA